MAPGASGGAEGSRRDAQDGAKSAPRQPQEALWSPGGLILEAPRDDFRGLRGHIFEAPGQQETKRQKGRTCKTCNALKLKIGCPDRISQVFTPSHLLSLATRSIYMKPHRFLPLLLAALSVPVLAQV